MQEIPDLPKEAVASNFCDELNNLMEVAVVDRDLGVQLCCQVMNDHCYLPKFATNEPMLRRSIELQSDLLSDVLQWEILQIDEDHFKSLGSMQEKKVYLFSKMDDEKK